MSAVFFREQPGIFCKCLFSKEQNSSSVVFAMFSFPTTFHIMPVCVESTIFFFFCISLAHQLGEQQNNNFQYLDFNVCVFVTKQLKWLLKLPWHLDFVIGNVFIFVCLASQQSDNENAFKQKEWRKKIWFKCFVVVVVVRQTSTVVIQQPRSTLNESSETKAPKAMGLFLNCLPRPRNMIINEL